MGFSTLAIQMPGDTQAQKYIIGVEDVAYYLLFENQSDRNTFAKELLNTFTASKGYKFAYLPPPIKRFDAWLLEEKVDFKYPDNARWCSCKSLRKFHVQKFNN